MKMGGFGAVDLISRTEQAKKGAADLMSGAMSNKTSTKASEKTAGTAALSSSSRPSTKAASRLSNSSNETSKDFSTVLEETSETKNRLAETPSDSNKESLAVAANSQNVYRTPEQRPTTTPDSREATPVESDPSTHANPNTSVESKVGDRARIAASVEPGSIEGKINDIAESLEETSAAELSMRHLSMRDFLSKMKDEFGIEPQAIVNAFAKLDATALTASPETTASAVLSQLGLKPEQMPKAERIYTEMLNQTGESALSETLVGVGAGISLKVLSEQDVAMDKLQKSILTLNDAFARRDLATPVAVPVTTAVVPDAAASASKLATELQMAKPETADTRANPVGKKEEESSNSVSKFASIGAALSSATAGLAGQNFSGSGGKDADSKPKDASNEIVSKPRAFDSIESALAPGIEVANMGGERAATPLASGSATSAALAASLASKDGEGTATNAQDLVRHAQILIKNGGGEMKMQLKPEGVGDVTLKVAVKDGQVQIQMMTETDSAKRVLESNLDDLKTSLAQNKLHIDALKIEVGGEMAKQRFEQAQQDANREQTRQMAQDFMGQFRNDREGFRQGFGDLSGFRNYQQPRKNPLPEVEPVVAAAVSNKKSSGERRLNLVA